MPGSSPISAPPSAERLDTLWQTEPIPFRRQNHGDYLIPSLTLRPELAPGQSGLGGAFA